MVCRGMGGSLEGGLAGGGVLEGLPEGGGGTLSFCVMFWQLIFVVPNSELNYINNSLASCLFVIIAVWFYQAHSTAISQKQMLSTLLH